LVLRGVLDLHAAFCRIPVPLWWLTTRAFGGIHRLGQSGEPQLTHSQRVIVAAEAWMRAIRGGLVQTIGGDRRSKARSAPLIKDPRAHFAKEYEVWEKY
jgi:hypothetical protein